MAFWRVTFGADGIALNIDGTVDERSATDVNILNPTVTL